MNVEAVQTVATGPFERVPLDLSAVPADHLNLAGRQRTNPFPWRGQFSPELVELLLSNFGPGSGVVLDPFAGVGTTLWEAARRGLDAVGTELNPAAVSMAQSIRFIPLSHDDRVRAIRATKVRLEDILGGSQLGPLYGQDKSVAPGDSGFVVRKLAQAIQSAGDAFERIILCNVLLRAMAVASPPSVDVVFRETANYSDAIRDLPHSDRDPKVFHADARNTPVADQSIDLILTSPPYINVFNYHQNGREAMEALGWDLLRVARSEFGANRKHRGNRFLTVIQYALDMAEWLAEMRRVLACNGRAIVVIGRESKVRGVALRNGELLATLAEACGFQLALRQERQFVTRFGELIVEDILHFRHRDGVLVAGSNVARQIAVELLRSAVRPGLSPDVALDLHAAIREATAVRPSPRLPTGSTSWPKW